MKKIICICVLTNILSPVFGQLKISGKITPSAEWEKKLYVIRIDRITTPIPKLVDSVMLKNDGSFSYVLEHNPQGILYLFRLPQKGTSYKSVTSGTTDNYFILSNEDRRPIKITAHSDSLFYSLKIDGRSQNKDLLIFRDFKKPIYRLVKQLSDSILLHPEKAEDYKRGSFPIVLNYADKIKKQVLGVLDTAKNISVKLEGLYYLMDASLGQLTNDEMKKYVADISNENILLVRNIKSGKDKEAKRTGISLSSFNVSDLNGASQSISQIKGKYKVLDFWASWCGPCRYANKNQLPTLNKFLESKNIPLLSITIDDDLKKWKEAVKKDGTAWKQFSDQSHLLSKSLGIEGVPLYLVADENNIIVYETSSVFAIELFLKER